VPDLVTPSLRRRAIVVAAAGALLLGACAQEASDPVTASGSGGSGGSGGGSGGTGGTADVDLVAAIDATRSVDSADVVMTLDVESPVGGGNVELAGDVSHDDVGTVTGSAQSGGVAYEIEMLADGETVWITSDASEFTAALPAGATWVEGSVDELRDAGVWTGIDTTFDVLSVLRGVEGVTDAGTTEVGGDEVRLFEGDVDWDLALEESEPDERAALQETIILTGDAELRTFTVQVGLDDDDRVRVLDLEMVAAPPDAAEDMPLMGEITMRIEMEVDSVDHEVDAPDAPPADETVPLSEVPEVAEMLADGI
jgi:hypothetical protein